MKEEVHVNSQPSISPTIKLLITIIYEGSQVQSVKTWKLNATSHLKRQSTKHEFNSSINLLDKGMVSI